jgi:hypothetical protein
MTSDGSDRPQRHPVAYCEAAHHDLDSSSPVWVSEDASLHLLHRGDVIPRRDPSERGSRWKGSLHGENGGFADHDRLFGVDQEAVAEQPAARPGIRSWLQGFQSTSSMVLCRNWSSTASTSGVIESEDTALQHFGSNPGLLIAGGVAPVGASSMSTSLRRRSGRHSRPNQLGVVAGDRLTPPGTPGVAGC